MMGGVKMYHRTRHKYVGTDSLLVVVVNWSDTLYAQLIDVAAVKEEVVVVRIYFLQYSARSAKWQPCRKRKPIISTSTRTTQIAKRT